MSTISSFFTDGLTARLKGYEAEEGLQRLAQTANRHVDRFLLALTHIETMQSRLDLRDTTTLATTIDACRDRRLRFGDLPHTTRRFVRAFVGEPKPEETHDAAPVARQLGEILQANVAALLDHVPLYFVAMQEFCHCVDPDLLPLRGYTRELNDILSDLPLLAGRLKQLALPVDLSGPVSDWPPVPDRTWDQFPHWGTPERAAEVDKERFAAYFRHASENLETALNTIAPRLANRPLVDLLVEKRYYNLIFAAAAINPRFDEQVSIVLQNS